MNIMQEMHDSEINCSISSFWDSSWTAKIGDNMNGFVAEVNRLDSFEDCEDWLRVEAIRLYPSSTFAKKQRIISGAY